MPSKVRKTRARRDRLLLLMGGIGLLRLRLRLRLRLAGAARQSRKQPGAIRRIHPTVRRLHTELSGCGRLYAAYFPQSSQSNWECGICLRLLPVRNSGIHCVSTICYTIVGVHENRNYCGNMRG